MFHRCAFEGRVDVAAPHEATKLVFYASAFQQGRHIEIRYPFEVSEAEEKDGPSRKSRFVLSRGYSPANFDQDRLELRLCYCDLAGRIVIREHPWAVDPALLDSLSSPAVGASGKSKNDRLWPIRYDPDAGLGINLCGSTLSGSLNLRWLRVKWINCERLTVLGGALFANHFAMHPKGNHWYRVPPEVAYFVFDEFVGFRTKLLGCGAERPRFSGLIHHSQRLMEYSNEGAQRIEMKRRIAQQYEDLRKAFGNASNAHYHEDFCHYKAMMYKGEIERELSKPVWREFRSRTAKWFLGTWRWIVFWVVLGCAILAILTCWSADGSGVGTTADHLSNPWTFVCYLVLGVAVLGVALPLEVTRWIRAWVERFVLRELFAYLVYPRRIVCTAIGMIFLFTVIYATVDWADQIMGYNQRLGRVKNTSTSVSCNEKEKEKAKEQERTTPLATIARSLHLSAVTFTTVGLFDVNPTGTMRVVANLEAFVERALPGDDHGRHGTPSDATLTGSVVPIIRTTGTARCRR